MARAGEMGYPSALSAKTWGFYDVSFRGRELKFQRPYGSYVMENVLFKISYPAEFHAQTAVEAAMTLRTRLCQAGKTAADIHRIKLRTHEACLRIIDKKGPLENPADRDHCVQYMIAMEETVEYPIGHRRRREEGMPLLLEKFKVNLGRRFGEEQQRRILEASLDSARLDSTPVNDYVDLYVAPDPA